MEFLTNSEQAKLVRVTHGEVFDVAVDIRQGSPTFGKWIGIQLSEANHLQMYIPGGFAHGFCVLSDTAEFLYKCSAYYAPSGERAILWNDPDIGIDWPIKNPILSEKDTIAPRLRDF
jgi:dTDP-4-dehydrorhamnose 3,5-epimerase